MNATTSNDIPSTAIRNEIEELREGVKHLAKATDDCVHSYAWTSIGLAAALGLCVGLLIGGPGKSSNE